MNFFEDCLKRNELGAMLHEQYGKHGHLDSEGADVIWEASKLEMRSALAVHPNITKPELAAMAAVTVMNESVFNLRQKPNPNIKTRPENIHCPAAWDYGWTQINFFYSVLDNWERVTNMRDLPWYFVFGKPPYLPEAPFTGDPIFNTRAAIRIMLSKRASRDAPGESLSLMETQVARYPGGDQKRTDHRRADWRKYNGLFAEFFKSYGEGK